MEGAVKRKVTARVVYTASAPTSPRSRPGSPTKSSLGATPIRAKAKVNSGALQVRRTPSVNSVSSSFASAPSRRPNEHLNNASPTPRAGTPQSSFHLPPSREDPSSPSGSQVGSRPRVAVKPPSSTLNPTPMMSSVSSSSSPSPGSVAHSRSLTANSSPTMSPRSIRRDSISLTTFSSLHSGAPSVSYAPSEPVPFSDAAHAPPIIRVRSKVSGLAKNIETASSTPSPVPTPNATFPRPAKSHSRTTSLTQSQFTPPSTPPSLSSSPPLHSQTTFYPITTAVPAANPHRFAQPRPSPSKHAYTQPMYVSPSASQTQTPSNNGDGYVNKSRPRLAVAKVDPSLIEGPHPPQSPPSSSLSFSSSRSSLSDTGSSLVPPSSNGRRVGMRTSLDGVVLRNGFGDQGDSPTGDEGSIRKVKAEAKSNRKIADLEITNRSLLAINASLEQTKHRQAKEIRELRRKLRESRLVLPPRLYRAVAHDDEVDPDDEEGDDEADEAQEAGDDKAVEGQDDEVYKRIRVILEGLIESGKRALETKPDDFVGTSKGGAKVLSAEEVRDWGGLEAGEATSRPITPSLLVVPDGGNGSEDPLSDFEDDDVSMSTGPGRTPSPQPPPIRITAHPS